MDNDQVVSGNEELVVTEDAAEAESGPGRAEEGGADPPQGARSKGVRRRGSRGSG